ncbi:MAG: hypothetical protein KDB90_10040 [Planctomycetes bacterium]|nr:hypothetical protein [Planctomycetota bacterium]
MLPILMVLLKQGDTSKMPFFLFLGALMLLLVIVTVIVGLAQSKKQKKWAAGVGLQYNNKGLSGVDDMSGAYNGFQVEVAQTGMGSNTRTTFTVFFPRPILPAFELLKSNDPVKFSEREIGPPVGTGNPSLDRTWGLFTRHPNEVCSVITDQRIVGILASAATRYDRVWISEEMIVYYAKPRGTSTAAYTGHLKALTAAAATMYEIATGQPAPRGRSPGRRPGGPPRAMRNFAPAPPAQVPAPPPSQVPAPPPAAPPGASPSGRRPAAMPRPRRRRM